MTDSLYHHTWYCYRDGELVDTIVKILQTAYYYDVFSIREMYYPSDFIVYEICGKDKSVEFDKVLSCNIIKERNPESSEYDEVKKFFGLKEKEMKIEAGKYYKTRDGVDIVGPMLVNEKDGYWKNKGHCFYADNNPLSASGDQWVFYSEKGFYLSSGEETKHDLVEEVKIIFPKISGLETSSVIIDDCVGYLDGNPTFVDVKTNITDFDGEYKMENTQLEEQPNPSWGHAHNPEWVKWSFNRLDGHIIAELAQVQQTDGDYVLKCEPNMYKIKQQIPTPQLGYNPL